MNTLQDVINNETDIKKLQDSVTELSNKKGFADSECKPQIEQMEKIIKDRINFLI